MTRETKIGLLVGLAFIIVIGILLSDHLASSTEPPQAPLSASGIAARAATAVPGAPTAVAPVTPAIITPTPIVPVTPVPTPQELRKPVEIVSIDPPAHTGPIAIVTPPPAGPIVPPTVHGPGDVEAGPGAGHETGLALLNTGTQKHGEEFVKAREYKAQSGDTLSKMAARLMGGNTKANRDAIVRANKSLQGSHAKIIVGRPYMIPVIEKSAPVDTALARSPAPTTAPSDLIGPLTVPPATMENIYTVKSGDNLWKIAATQLGNRNAVAAIKELNKDVLKGSDKLQVNMKLRLPARPMASAR